MSSQASENSMGWKPLLIGSFVPATVGTILLFGVNELFLGAWVCAFIVSFAHATLLGLPLYKILKKHEYTQWWVSLICGFMIGALPFALISHPRGREGGNMSYMVNGKTVSFIAPAYTPSMAEWIKFAEPVLLAGLLGMSGGFSAWLVWRESLMKSKGSK